MRHHVPILVAVISSIAIVFAQPAAAQPEIFPDVAWTVSPAFGQGGEGRSNVSGATCLDAEVARPTCLVVNDSARFAQFFTFVGQQIRSGPLVGISGTAAPSRIIGTPNIEGAAHDDRFFYVVTSKGRPSLPPPQIDTDFLVARFPSDTTTPPPAPPGTVPGLQVSDRFRTALAAGIAVPGVPNQKIDRTNSDIQGIAITPSVSPRGGVVNLGLRSPNIFGKSFILRAPVDSVFAASGAFTPSVTSLALGLDAGISDLAAVDDGILILANRNVQPRASLFLLQNDGQLKHLANVAEPTNRIAEALLVLNQDPEFYVVLLMFDGVANGEPQQYLVPR